MAYNSKIQWTDHTFNAAEAQWRQPLKWDREAKAEGVRRRVFCVSLGDVFEAREELDPVRERLFDLIQSTPNLDWLLLTKRPENFEDMLPWTSAHAGEYRHEYWNNVWLGVTAENQRMADERIPILCGIPAAKRFVSAEPLLGPINFKRLLTCYCPWGCGPIGKSLRCGQCKWCGDDSFRIHWIIFGGESGPNARPCNIKWIRDGVKQCKQAGVKAFVKQLGARPFWRPKDGPCPLFPDHVNIKYQRGYADSEHGIVFRDPKGGNPDEWPEDLRVREVPT